VTLAVTGLVVAFCFLVRRHYEGVKTSLRRLDTILDALPAEAATAAPQLAPQQPTAVLLVGGYGGLGVHAMLTVQRTFPGHFKNFVFVSIGVIDAATMKGVSEVERLRTRTEASLRHYQELANRFGLAAETRLGLGTDVLDEGESVCAAIRRDYPKAVFFLGKLVFKRERFFQRVLHNETAYQLQRRLQFAGMHAMVLPVRVT
jgi:hypothetical protein